MKKGILLPLILAIGAAVVYAMIVNSQSSKLNASKTIKRVLVPIRDIKEREVIKRDAIKWVPIPSAYVQKDALTYTTDADFKAVENAVARIQIPKGNQISKYSITSLADMLHASAIAAIKSSLFGTMDVSQRCTDDFAVKILSANSRME